MLSLNKKCLTLIKSFFKLKVKYKLKEQIISILILIKSRFTLKLLKNLIKL